VTQDSLGVGGIDPDDVQPNECHKCGHTAAWCACEEPEIDEPDDE
jgi:hypothetical protein